MLVCLQRSYLPDSPGRPRERYKLTNSKTESTDVQEGADCLIVARIVRESGKEPRRQVIQLNYFTQPAKREDENDSNKVNTCDKRNGQGSL
jgi:hypothetical protein